jgi:hypothetical protein
VLDFGVSFISPVTRDPTFTAWAMATLQEISGDPNPRARTSGAIDA